MEIAVCDSVPAVFHVGDTVRKYRKHLKMTLEELAQAAGINKMTLSELENGGNFQRQTLDKIAKAMDVSVNTLYQMSTPIQTLGGASSIEEAVSYLAGVLSGQFPSITISLASLREFVTLWAQASPEDQEFVLRFLRKVIPEEKRGER